MLGTVIFLNFFRVGRIINFNETFCDLLKGQELCGVHPFIINASSEHKSLSVRFAVWLVCYLLCIPVAAFSPCIWLGDILDGVGLVSHCLRLSSGLSLFILMETISNKITLSQKTGASQAVSDSLTQPDNALFQILLLTLMGGNKVNEKRFAA